LALQYINIFRQSAQNPYLSIFKLLLKHLYYEKIWFYASHGPVDVHRDCLLHPAFFLQDLIPILPYTSVFLQMDCAYWGPEQEKQLRDQMSD